MFPGAIEARHDRMVEVVERMLDPSAGSGQALHKQLPRAATPQKSEDLQPRPQAASLCP